MQITDLRVCVYANNPVFQFVIWIPGCKAVGNLFVPQLCGGVMVILVITSSVVSTLKTLGLGSLQIDSISWHFASLMISTNNCIAFPRPTTYLWKL